MDIETRNKRIKQLRSEGKLYEEIGDLMNLDLPREAVRDIAGISYKDNRKVLQKRTRLQIKTEVLTHYGNGKLACVQCGFANIHALTIDHINNDGAKFRKTNKKMSGIWMYYWLRANGYPKGYQTLCFNCQWIKRMSQL